MESESVKTILIEDHEITRLGMKKMLEHIPEITLIAEFSDGKEVVKGAQDLKADLVLVDIGLPGVDGIEVTRSLKDTLGCRVMIITSHDNEEDVLAALSAGADAYCLKAISTQQLADAVHSVMDGAVWLDPGIAAHVLSAIRRSEREIVRTSERGNVFKLSEREIQIISLVVEGLTNQEIADRLYLSVETVKTYMRRILEKLQVPDRTQAALKAVKHGLVTQPGPVKQKVASDWRLHPNAG